MACFRASKNEIRFGLVEVVLEIGPGDVNDDDEDRPFRIKRGAQR